MVEKYIFVVRSQRVMLSHRLAMLYGVKPKALVQAVKRNKSRFPADFMFTLSIEEERSLRSQFVTLDAGATRNASGRGRYSKYTSYAFTEQGVSMLSSVLRSKKAIRVNIAIMRAFVKIREILSTNKELAQKLKELESKIEKHDVDIHNIFDAIRRLMAVQERPKRQIGFHAG